MKSESISGGKNGYFNLPEICFYIITTKKRAGSNESAL